MKPADRKLGPGWAWTKNLLAEVITMAMGVDPDTILVVFAVERDAFPLYGREERRCVSADVTVLYGQLTIRPGDVHRARAAHSA